VLSLPLSHTLHRTLCWFEPDQEYFGFVVKIQSREKPAPDTPAAPDEDKAETSAPAPEDHTRPAAKDCSLDFQQPALAACRGGGVSRSESVEDAAAQSDCFSS
jgi:hypothetical protein